MEEKSSQVKKRVEINNRNRKTIISLWLDDYENFFSDFDPRPFSQRSLSDDFLYEAKKVTHEIKQAFNVTFLVPHNKRNKTMEKVIMTRLHAHFKKHDDRLEKENSLVKKKGILLALFGTLVMGLSVLTLDMQDAFHFMKYLPVMLDPSGWFCVWYGLDHIFYISKQNASELEFNKKMARAEYKFDAY